MATILRAPRLSHSLDRPLRHELFQSKRIIQKEDDTYLFTQQDTERYYLYLPRNLSYCHMCVDVLRQHVQQKVCLLNVKLSEALALPPKDTIVNYSDADDETGLWLKTHEEQTNNESLKPKRILKTAAFRAKSFPSQQQRKPKKVLRFADSLGLELETIRHVIRSELPPCIPARAFNDIRLRQDQQEQMFLVPDFCNPSTSSDFNLRLHNQKVCLHSVTTIETTIYGIVCVVNLTYHKFVKVRYTINGWKSYHDLEASYLHPDNARPTDFEERVDKFTFTIFVDRHDFTTAYNVRNKVHFAVSYQTEDGREYWDNKLQITN